MLDSTFVIVFWLVFGLGIGAIVGIVLHANAEFDRRMNELDSVIEELNASVNDCIEARNRLTELTVSVYKHLKETMQ